jgi:hypothetical protein
MYCALFPEVYVTTTEIKAEEYIAPESMTMTMTGKNIEFLRPGFASR